MKKFAHKVLIIIIGLIQACSNTEPQKSGTPTDQECIRERLLSLTRDENPELFAFHDGTPDILEEIRSLVLREELYLWEEKNNEDITLMSVEYWKSSDSTVYGDGNYYNPYFDFMSEGPSPIHNHNGEDSIRTNEDGSMQYVYPVVKYRRINISDVTEFRIKEIRTNDVTESTNIFEPTFVGFDIFTFYHKIHFWVKLEDLQEKIKVNRNWLNNIQSGNYHGFQYLRYRCSDPEYTIRKVYH